MIYSCVGRYSETAYQIPELSCAVHSFEELCYVINENLYSLGDYIISDELIRFIEINLELKDLAELLIRKKRQPVEFIMSILTYGHFLTESKAEKARQIMSSMEDIREYVRLISRADFLKENKRYKSAILMYEHAVELMKEETERDEDQYREVLTRLGALYSLYFMFDKAYKCYHEAGDEKKSLICRRLSMSRVDYADMLLIERPPEELIEGVNALFTKPEEITVLESRLADGGEKAVREYAYRLAERLKDEYRRIS